MYQFISPFLSICFYLLFLQYLYLSFPLSLSVSIPSSHYIDFYLPLSGYHFLSPHSFSLSVSISSSHYIYFYHPLSRYQFLSLPLYISVSIPLPLYLFPSFSNPFLSHPDSVIYSKMLFSRPVVNFLRSLFPLTILFNCVRLLYYIERYHLFPNRRQFILIDFFLCKTDMYFLN